MVVKGLTKAEELSITGFSIEWVLDKLEKYCDDYRKAKDGKTVVDIEANDVSDGKGFLSRVFITKITFDDQTEYVLALKVPTYEIIESKMKGVEGISEEQIEKMNDFILESHNVECDAIAMVSKFKNFPSPKLYYAEKSNQGRDCGLPGKTSPGIIIMAAVDGASIGAIKSVTVQQCLNVARDFAILQDYIAQLPEGDWKEKFHSTLHFDEHVFEHGKIAAQELEQSFSDLSKSTELLTKVDWGKYSEYALHERPAELNAWTYIHGDTWTNNIMFKKNGDGSVSDEILCYIDYQVGFQGNPLFDLARFMCVCPDGEIRREATIPTLKQYYDKLTELYAERKATVPYSFEDVKELYNLAFAHQSLLACSLLKFLGMDGDASEDVKEAQSAKVALRMKFLIQDAFKILHDYNLEKLGLFLTEVEE
ncbi:unnamed protein product [Bursaphelenchus okinawaensis]|uniref:CHK kinase-like domain-containing protein n=1 Tax=Bursaphelenchus okinawaensis TaxID=465554 RepID=A0A811KUX5_9BILA|nr:unnamed protein product [Bursaphelenchus okinawaensis]CAG9113693.1 unnamed protein product [Bursaphelenchus okinawaensis]